MTKLSWHNNEGTLVSKFEDIIFEIIPGADGFTLWQMEDKQTSLEGVFQNKIGAKSAARKLVRQKLLKLV